MFYEEWPPRLKGIHRDNGRVADEYDPGDEVNEEKIDWKEIARLMYKSGNVPVTNKANFYRRRDRERKAK